MVTGDTVGYKVATAEDTTLAAGETLEITGADLSGKSLYVKCDALGLIEYAPTLS
jgi:hypothetical protein